MSERALATTTSAGCRIAAASAPTKLRGRSRFTNRWATGPQLAALFRAVETATMSTATHCPYCALQCGMHLVRDADLHVIGNAKFPVNEGGLCVKGWSAAATLEHRDR